LSSTSASDGTSGVIRLRPIRSLVLGSDLGYRDRALAVLGGLGPVVFAITALWECDELGDVLALVRHEHPDVVVLDATGCEAGVERVILELADTAPRIGIVVVCEHSTAAARRLDALPKWGWTKDLRSAVERAYADGNPRRPGALAAVRRRGPALRVAGPLAGWTDGAAPRPEP
jgi:hypothetical protein